MAGFGELLRRVIASAEGPLGPGAENTIGDRQFSEQLREVRNLKRFLFEEKVKLKPEQLASIDLGELNNLRFRAYGRSPSDVEWRLLDTKFTVLAEYLNDDLRQKIRIRELGAFFGSLPLAFLVLAMVSTVYYYLFPSFFAAQTIPSILSFIISLIAWTVAQGGLGACAFLGTRVAVKRAAGDSLSAAGDEAGDITDRNVLKIRIVLGCLFAFLIGLPIAGLSLGKLSDALASKDLPNPQDFALVVTPFIVGFSTNLVLALLDRCVVSIRTFLGITK